MKFICSVQINLAPFFLRLPFQDSQAKCYNPSNKAAGALYNVSKTKLSLRMPMKFDVLNSFHQVGLKPKEIIANIGQFEQNVGMKGISKQRRDAN